MKLDIKKSDQIDSRDKRQVNLEAEAARIVKEQILNGMWNLQIVIFSYAVTIAIVIMAFKGVRLEVVSLSAIFGLTIVWIWGRLRYKRLYQRLFQNEIHHLQELTNRYNLDGLRVNSIVEIEENTSLHLVTSPLTPRQQEILSLIVAGNSNKQIANQLNLSERTIKNQLGYVFKKLDVEDRTQAVLVSIRNGWILPEMDKHYQPTFTFSSGRAVGRTDDRQESRTPVSKFAHYL